MEAAAAAAPAAVAAAIARLEGGRAANPGVQKFSWAVEVERERERDGMC